MNIFIAGSWLRRTELRRRADELEAMGHTVTSRWIGPLGDTKKIGWAQASFNDVEDVRHSDCVIVQLEDPTAGYMTGGRWVEMGVGIAVGARVMVVGRPVKENVHCHFAGDEANGLKPVEHYATWEELYDALRPEPAEPEKRPTHFEVGQRVCVAGPYSIYTGLCGTVTIAIEDPPASTYPYQVALDCKQKLWFDTDELEAIDPPTAITPAEDIGDLRARIARLEEDIKYLRAGVSGQQLYGEAIQANRPLPVQL